MKKRISTLVIAGVLSLSLFSCAGSPTKAPVNDAPSAPTIATPSIEMSVQKYEGQNIIEIPKFVSGTKNEACDTLNAKANELQKKYDAYINGKSDGVAWAEVKSYPFTSKEYVQAIITAIEYPIYGTDGDVFSYNYDIKTGKIVTLDDALKMAKLDETKITENVKKLFVPESKTISLGEVKPCAFRIWDGGIDFMLKVTVKNPEADDWVRIYKYSPTKNTLAEYDHNCLFLPNEPDVMTPPLYYGKQPKTK